MELWNLAAGANMPEINQWEADGRAKKVDALVPAMLIQLNRLTPEQLPDGDLTAENVGGVLRGLPRVTWLQAARDIGVKPPSPKTIEAVTLHIEAMYAQASGETEGYEPGQEWD